MITVIVVGLLSHGAMYGPQAAFLAEMFPTRIRYSGVSLAYQFTSIIAGSLAPVIAIAIIRETGSAHGVVLYMGDASAVTLVAALLAREARGRSFAQIDALLARRSPSSMVAEKIWPVGFMHNELGFFDHETGARTCRAESLGGTGITYVSGISVTNVLGRTDEKMTRPERETSNSSKGADCLLGTLAEWAENLKYSPTSQDEAMPYREAVSSDAAACRCRQQKLQEIGDVRTRADALVPAEPILSSCARNLER